VTHPALCPADGRRRADPWRTDSEADGLMRQFAGFQVEQHEAFQ